ncbi:universal stress protein [Halostagnicola kamekurae]|uniref:Nucleotide-binding universal stress protein, UspA family n=1 Tax=Halostagnicola kamekurae TaxID=619731 RepID=A0A1I6UVY1_9EURY|nr:universal stress protein [Halostagnicola kamekurae]SFT05544.1 Nucleotide-binding universal stress protein, UspA family [Halostagnicola kamekurae]
MTERILVPIDDTPLTEKVVEYAFERYSDGDIIALHVVTMAEDAPLELSDVSHRNQYDPSSKLFERAEKIANDQGRRIESVTLFGSPARSILQYEREEDVDAIVLGSHGRHGMERFLLGSVAETVTRRAPVPVTVVK